MRYHAQNLNESRTGEVVGSILFHGRAWFNRFRCEWLTLHKARGFAATISFGTEDSGRGVMLHICLPFVFSVFFTIDGLFRCEECKTGIAIHNQAVWFYFLPYVMKSDRKDPWYRRNYSWNFPWQLDWHSTEILTQHTPELAKVVYREQRGDRRKRGIDSFEMMRKADVAKDTVKETHDYRYVLKNGAVQERKATIHVERMSWRARWYPIIPIKKVSTSIWVDFNDEVGEGTGSWKGGTTGCGYTMLPNETPWQCLKRMENERKFDR